MNFECPICKDTGDAQGTAENGLCMVADCGHVVHKHCMQQWKSRGNETCPVCRQFCKKTCTLYGATVAENDEKKKKAHVHACESCLIYRFNEFAQAKKELEQARETLKDKQKFSSLQDFQILQLKCELQTYKLRLKILNLSNALRMEKI